MTSLIIVMTCKHVAPIRNRGSVGLSVGVIIMGMTQKSDLKSLNFCPTLFSRLKVHARSARANILLKVGSLRQVLVACEAGTSLPVTSCCFTPQHQQDSYRCSFFLNTSVAFSQSSTL